MILVAHYTPKRVIPSRWDRDRAERRSHKCARRHASNATASPSPLMYADIAERTETSLEHKHDFVSSLAPLGMTASDPRDRP